MSNTFGTDPLHIRYGTEADSHVLADLGARTFADSFARDNSPEDMAAYLADSFGVEKQAQELADPASRFLIAELNREPVGYARLRSGPAPAAVKGRNPMEVVRFYARSEWIGKGIGAGLMKRCLDEAEQADCGVLWLGVWQRNERAIDFYRKWGFVRVGTQTFTLGTDAQTDWIMARSIE
jgi:GNAT superfamily N-acetyltransferase